MSTFWSGFAGVVLGRLISASATWFSAKSTAKHAAESNREGRRVQAYGDFLTAVGLIVFTADSVRTLLVQRSGLKEGFLTAA